VKILNPLPDKLVPLSFNLGLVTSAPGVAPSEFSVDGVLLFSVSLGLGILIG